MERRMNKTSLSIALFISALACSVAMEPRITSSMLMAGSGSGIVETSAELAHLSKLTLWGIAAALGALLLLAAKRSIASPLLYMAFIGVFLAFDTFGTHLPDQAYHNGRFILGLTAMIFPLTCLGMMLIPSSPTQQRS